MGGMITQESSFCVRVVLCVCVYVCLIAQRAQQHTDPKKPHTATAAAAYALSAGF
jgi:hypothetical protein